MKFIIRVDTDEIKQINEIAKNMEEKTNWVLPQGVSMRVYVVSDSGEVKELK